MGKDKTSKGYFTPQNPEKYTGKLPIVYRSSWELTVMMFYDRHPYVLEWKSETVQIRYRIPGENKVRIYIPDFIVAYYNPTSGQKVIEMVEVKPLKETPGYQALSEKTGKPLKQNKYTQAAQIINQFKWEAARRYCSQLGWKFSVVTEQTLYAMNKPK